MDTWRVEPLYDRTIGPPARTMGAETMRAETARYGVAGLSLRLTLLQQKLERDFPLTLALDLTDREAADGLSPELTATIHAMLLEGALDAASRLGVTLIRLGIHVSHGSVLLRIEDDGAGFAFKGTYNLAELMAFGVGPQELAHQVAARGGQLRLDCQSHSSRIDITLPRVSAAPAQPVTEDISAVAAE